MVKRQRSRPRTPRGVRDVKRLPAWDVVFEVEGKTEERYLSALQQSRYDHRLVLKSEAPKNASSLFNLIKAARRSEKDHRGSHIWIICDTDENSAHREALESWLRESEYHHIALIHPSIEYWLLEHLCDAASPQNARQATEALKARMPEYRKGASLSSVTDGIDKACERERKRWNSAGQPDLWGGSTGTTCHLMIGFLDELAQKHEREEKLLKEKGWALRLQR